MIGEQALTTLKAARMSLGLYTYTRVPGPATLTTESANATYPHEDIQELGTLAETTGTASDTVSTANLTWDGETLTFTATITGTITATNYAYIAWDITNDMFLETQINSVSEMISRYCGRSFLADSYEEAYAGRGSTWLLLDQYPVNVIESVEYAGQELVAGTDYETANETFLQRGILLRDSGWPRCGLATGLVGDLVGTTTNIVVSYSAGYTSVPADIESVALMLIGQSYRAIREGTTGLVSMTQGRLSYTWKTESGVEQFSSVLNKYRRW